jgi:ankyrin repeat protein
MTVKRITLCVAACLISAVSVLGAEITPVADAAERMDQKKLRALLEQRVDVNAAQTDGMTALHWAAYHDDLAMAKLLLRAGANAKAANRYGVTPLTLACTNGNGEFVEALLEAGADANSTLSGGESALMTASRSGNLRAVKALLARGANVNAVVRGMGRTERAGANAFLNRLADPTVLGFKAKTEQTALVWATEEGHAEVVEELIKAGADFKFVMESGFTPFLFAVRGGHIGVAKVFLKAGVDVNQTLNPGKMWQSPGYTELLKAGATPLHVAVENAQFEMAAYLVESGANPNAADPTGYAPLHGLIAARRTPPGDSNPPPQGNGNMTALDFVKQIAARGANMNAKLRRGGMTPLLMAAETADLALMKALIEAGADPLLGNSDNATTLLLAGRVTGTPDEVMRAMQLALDSGIDINSADINGQTAMHMAASKNLPDAIKFLAKKGAKIEVWNKPDNAGLTPLAIAVGFNRRNVFRPLPEAEAAIREVMIAAGVTPPEKVVVQAAGQP